MKRTSRSSSAGRIAARAPAPSTAGPLVYRTLTPSPRATMVASVVLPSPGGPYSRTWSAASPLALAAWRRTARLALTSRWPMYSSSVRGRREPSTASSPVSVAPAARRLRASSVIGRSLAGSSANWYGCSIAPVPLRDEPLELRDDGLRGRHGLDLALDPLGGVREAPLGEDRVHRVADGRGVLHLAPDHHADAGRLAALGVRGLIRGDGHEHHRDPSREGREHRPGAGVEH